jgi:hypothetical protein
MFLMRGKFIWGMGKDGYKIIILIHRGIVVREIWCGRLIEI